MSLVIKVQKIRSDIMKFSIQMQKIPAEFYLQLKYHWRNYLLAQNSLKCSSYFSIKAVCHCHGSSIIIVRAISDKVSTYWGQMMHICISKLGHHWFRSWLITCLSLYSYLSLYWLIVNWIFWNRFQWNLNENQTNFRSIKWIWKCCLQNGSHFVSSSMC